jgi:predicted dinucleotide-binding enzyme
LALARAKIPATPAYNRRPASRGRLVGELSPPITAGTRQEAAAMASVLAAVSRSKLALALAALPTWKSRIVIDANNPLVPHAVDRATRVLDLRILHKSPIEHWT